MAGYGERSRACVERNALPIDDRVGCGTADPILCITLEPFADLERALWL